MNFDTIRLGFAVSLLKAIRADASAYQWHDAIGKCLAGMDEPHPHLAEAADALRQKSEQERERDEYRYAHEANVRDRNPG